MQNHPPFPPLSPPPRQNPVQTPQHLLPHLPLPDQILPQPPHQLHHLVRLQPMHGRLNHPAHARLVHRDETRVVHETEQPHDELAVHAVRDAPVARDRLAEVFDFEGAFEPRGEEAAEGGDEGGKGREDEDVELHRGDVESWGEFGEEGGEVVGDAVGVGDEDGVGGAGEAGDDVGAEVLGKEGVQCVFRVGEGGGLGGLR